MGRKDVRELQRVGVTLPPGSTKDALQQIHADWRLYQEFFHQRTVTACNGPSGFTGHCRGLLAWALVLRAGRPLVVGLRLLLAIELSFESGYHGTAWHCSLALRGGRCASCCRKL